MNEMNEAKIEELIALGGTQILMQGGLVPDESHPSGQGLPFAWYLGLLRYIKRHYPGIHIHAFSPLLLRCRRISPGGSACDRSNWPAGRSAATRNLPQPAIAHGDRRDRMPARPGT